MDERDERYGEYLKTQRLSKSRNAIAASAVALTAMMIVGIFKNRTGGATAIYYLAVTSGYIALLLANLKLNGKRETGGRDAKIAAAVAALFLTLWIYLYAI